MNDITILDQSNDPLTYEEICALARDLGVGRESLIALSPDNDPFYAGRGDRYALGQWFADLWDHFQFPTGVHLRGIHYRLVSQREPVPTPKGDSYENTNDCWKLLQKASASARFLDLVPTSAFVDRRADPPLVHLENPCDEQIEIKMEYATPEALTPTMMPPMPNLAVKMTVSPTRAQRYHIELWAEKTTMNYVLEPLARTYGLNVITGTGELSITHCLNAVERAVRSERPVRILYISDFDPGGRSMPVSVARKIEFEIRRQGLDLDVQLRPIVLTQAQCVEYALPRTPIKESEKRGARFEARFGAGATELDALEALHPGVLRRILVGEIARYYDHDFRQAVADVVQDLEQEVSDEASEVVSEAYEGHAEQVAELESEWQKIAAQIRAWCERAAPVWQAIAEEIRENAPEVPEIEWPEPAEGDEDENPLYDSTRVYLQQLHAYRAWQGKPLLNGASD